MTDITKVRFHHFHDIDTNQLAATIATRYVDADNVEVAAAIVSRRDQPLKERGKMIALARLDQHKKTVVLPLVELRKQITERTILANFHQHAGEEHTQFTLRPRKEFVPDGQRDTLPG